VFYIDSVVSEEILLKILEEISKIRQLVEILAIDALKRDLEKVATTNERKKIWALCNGSLSTEEIAKKVNVTTRAVQIFVKELQKLDLIEFERRGYPKRKVDYVPPEWRSSLG